VAKYKVTIDRSKCVSCRAAPATCPDVYVLEDKNRVVDKYSVELTPDRSVGIIPEELYECAKAGADVCPVSAITIEKIED